MALGYARSVAATATAMLALLAAPLAAAASPVDSSPGPAAAAVAANIFGFRPFPAPGSVSSDNLTVDLGYGLYRGTVDNSTRIRSWKGIPFAQPPIGSLRWQRPQPPSTDDPSAFYDATNYGPNCPQTPPAGLDQGWGPGSEDCLYINVYAPDSATPTAINGCTAQAKLPVLVWIHGGGYGQGNGANDLSPLINDNNNEFVAITIQYRLGAFGFLASAGVTANGGLPNAGLLDQAYALVWVQNYIALFGGDPAKVTISGESAGGGAVMHQTLAAGGNNDLQLFRNAIAASPYMPQQHAVDAAVPTQNYNDFAAAAGCASAGSSQDVWQCLIASDSLTLQYASSNVSANLAMVGTWAFTPVTDGTFVQGLATDQLAAKKVLGSSILVGNNADEAPSFVPDSINSEDKLLSWIQAAFPGLSTANVSELLHVYSTGGTDPDGSSLSFSRYSYPLNGPGFETDGISWPTASDVSMIATGPLQRAYNMYSEATFVCPAYFLADAYTTPSEGKQAFQYQYSVPFASHGSDVAAYIGSPSANQSPNFAKAFRQIWGGLVVRSDPSIVDGGGSTPYPFPPWTPSNHSLVSLNTTGGTASSVNVFGRPGTIYVEPGLQNLFKTADADAWEGGRAARCEFWRSVASLLPQ